MSYDTNNIFAKILRGEEPCQKVYEDENVLAFHDIHPNAPVHVLVIPKGEYISFDDFAANDDTTETTKVFMVAHFFQTIRKIAHQLGLEKDGYRIIANTGQEAGQIVPHFHVHILGKKKLGNIG